MRAERGQWQQHMKHSRMAKRGHKEGKKRAKPETVRMPGEATISVPNSPNEWVLKDTNNKF